MLWEPSSFGKDQGPRQNVRLAMERGSEAWGAWDDFEKKCVSELSLRSNLRRCKRQVAELPQRVLAGRHLPEAQAGRTERPFWDTDGNKIRLRVPGPRRGQASLDHG